MERYEYIGQAGSGAYGQVWVCRVRPLPDGEEATDGLQEGMLVACKVFRQAHTDKEIMRLALREVRVLKAISHDNCVRLLDAFKSKSGKVYLIFEYVEGCAYKELCKFRTGLPATSLKLMAFQLCLALRYLHGDKVVHRDLKPSNILIDNDSQVVKLCDFGFARFTSCTDPRDAERLSSYVVTRWYRAPEVLLSMEYGPASDIWGLGCTIAELAVGEPLMPGTSTADQLWRIMRVFGPLPPYMAGRLAVDARLASVRVPPRGRSLAARLHSIGPRLVQFLEACMRIDPLTRPTADELLRMPYFFEVPQLVAGTPLQELVARELAAGGPARRTAAAPFGAQNGPQANVAIATAKVAAGGGGAAAIKYATIAPPTGACEVAQTQPQSGAGVGVRVDTSAAAAAPLAHHQGPQQQRQQPQQEAATVATGEAAAAAGGAQLSAGTSSSSTTAAKGSKSLQAAGALLQSVSCSPLSPGTPDNTAPPSVTASSLPPVSSTDCTEEAEREGDQHATGEQVEEPEEMRREEVRTAQQQQEQQQEEEKHQEEKQQESPEHSTRPPSIQWGIAGVSEPSLSANLRHDYAEMLLAGGDPALAAIMNGSLGSAASGNSRGSTSLRAAAAAVFAAAEAQLLAEGGTGGGTAGGSTCGSQPSLQGWAAAAGQLRTCMALAKSLASPDKGLSVTQYTLPSLPEGERKARVLQNEAELQRLEAGEWWEQGKDTRTTAWDGSVDLQQQRPAPGVLDLSVPRPMEVPLLQPLPLLPPSRSVQVLYNSGPGNQEEQRCLAEVTRRRQLQAAAAAGPEAAAAQGSAPRGVEVEFKAAPPVPATGVPPLMGFCSSGSKPLVVRRLETANSESWRCPSMAHGTAGRTGGGSFGNIDGKPGWQLSSMPTSAKPMPGRLSLCGAVPVDQYAAGQPPAAAPGSGLTVELLTTGDHTSSLGGLSGTTYLGELAEVVTPLGAPQLQSCTGMVYPHRRPLHPTHLASNLLSDSGSITSGVWSPSGLSSHAMGDGAYVQTLTSAGSPRVGPSAPTACNNAANVATSHLAASSCKTQHHRTASGLTAVAADATAAAASGWRRTTPPDTFLGSSTAPVSPSGSINEPLHRNAAQQAHRHPFAARLPGLTQGAAAAALAPHARAASMGLMEGAGAGAGPSQGAPTAASESTKLPAPTHPSCGGCGDLDPAAAAAGSCPWDAGCTPPREVPDGGHDTGAQLPSLTASGPPGFSDPGGVSRFQGSSRGALPQRSSRLSSAGMVAESACVAATTVPSQDMPQQQPERRGSSDGDSCDAAAGAAAASASGSASVVDASAPAAAQAVAAALQQQKQLQQRLQPPVRASSSGNKIRGGLKSTSGAKDVWDEARGGGASTSTRMLRASSCGSGAGGHEASLLQRAKKKLQKLFSTSSGGNSGAGSAR